MACGRLSNDDEIYVWYKWTAVEVMGLHSYGTNMWVPRKCPRAGWVDMCIQPTRVLRSRARYYTLRNDLSPHIQWVSMLLLQLSTNPSFVVIAHLLWSSRRSSWSRCRSRFHRSFLWLWSLLNAAVLRPLMRNRLGRYTDWLSHCSFNISRSGRPSIFVRWNAVLWLAVSKIFVYQSPRTLLKYVI